MSREPSIPDDRPWTLTARWIFPVDQPPLEGGTVTVSAGRIASVKSANGVAADVDFGEAAIIPGLVNAHTHLDLTGLRGQAPPTPDFTGWLRQVISFRRTRSPEQVQEDIKAGIVESVRYGTTLLGDISSDGGSWEPLVNAPLRAVAYREFLGLPPDRALAAWERVQDWLKSTDVTPTCRPGISPHAPYSVRASLFPAAATRGVPVATHLAETPDEMELLALRQGPFVKFLQELGVWDSDGLAEGTEQVLRLLAGGSPTLIVHGNYLPPATAFPPNASLVYCPRTHAAFGHAPHPFRNLLGGGVRVALGTDSLASNPDLDLLAEARFLHQHHPDVRCDVILRMATLAGAEALGWGEQAGSLTPGKSADFAVVPLEPGGDADPHRRLLASRSPVAAVFFRGRSARQAKKTA
jgi:cytosine/adenosine deaminase-related metal-dependent hydrolase